MHRIVANERLAPSIHRITVEAPLIAKKRKPGQFIIFRINEHGERVPLTIFDADEQSGTITLVVQGIGKSTIDLCNMKNGGGVQDIVGPLGVPSEIIKYGTVVVMGGGVGIAVAYPTAKALKAAGNYVISITGYRSQEMVIIEEDISSVSDESYITTDDGSYGIKGFCTTKLAELIESGVQIDMVFAVGPIPMMRAVSELTRVHDIHTMVSLNPIMVDGTGMCGGCRATVDGKTVFVCVDGPEFDGHKVDFDQLMKRNRSYLLDEEKARDVHDCRLDSIFDTKIKNK